MSHTAEFAILPKAPEHLFNYTDFFDPEEVHTMDKKKQRKKSNTKEKVASSSKKSKQRCAGQCKLNRLLEGEVRTFPGKASLIQYFEVGFADERLHKDSIALIEEEKHVTYQELDEISTKLADLIKQQIDTHGLQNLNPDFDTVIGVCLPPSNKLIFILFAILKLGAAYIPFDNSFPEDRIVKIVNNCHPILIISDSHQHTISKFEPVHESTKVVDAEKLFEIITKDQRAHDEILLSMFPSRVTSLAERIALILYTSGSSGEPKGVRLSHRTVLNRLSWQWHEFPYIKGESCCLKTSLTFVDSVSEIFGPLLQGLPLYIFDKNITTHPNILIQRLNDYNITRLVLVPSLLRAILHTLELLGDEGKNLLANLKLWICSGETLTKELLILFFVRFPSSSTICNFYGSTEIMGDVTYHVFKSMRDVETNTKDVHVPIGTCIYNTLVYILDKHRKLVPEGNTGELYIAGYNLANGYVGIDKSDKFIENPYTKTEGFTKLFRTGDFGYIFKPKDGIRTLFYVGRIDSQVKIRGFRLDLSEIEATMNSKHQLIQKCVVLCYKAGTKDQALVAFIVPQEGVTAPRIDMMCKLSLRNYEIPELRLVEEIPLLVNGKIDRQRLLERYEIETKNKTPFDDWHLLLIPEDHLEATKKVVQVISEVTGTSEHDIVHDLDDSFYNLGGTSLNSVTIVTKLREAKMDISLPDFINAKSIRRIVEIIVANKTLVAQSNADIIHGKKSIYYSEPLTAEHQEEAVNIVAYSFAHKGDLEAFTHATFDEFVVCLKSIYTELVDKNYSFIVRHKKDKKLIGVSLNFDVYDEPSNSILASQGIQYCFDLLEFVEERQREKLPKGIGKLLHSFMMGTHQEIDDAENVGLVAYMEEENIRIALEKEFIGILTTNTNPLTQQICAELHGYETLFEYQVNQFQARDGTHPFKLAPDSQKAICSWKKVNSQTNLLPSESEQPAEESEKMDMD